MLELLRHQVLLLAMKNGRAPLPISPSLWKGLQRQGVLNDLYDLGEYCTTSLIPGRRRMLLAELKAQGGTRQAPEEETPKQMEIVGEGSPQPKDGRKWLRD
jgi:hypothetical protein